VRLCGGLGAAPSGGCPYTVIGWRGDRLVAVIARMRWPVAR
jgi:hypothetical protein